MEVGPVLVDGNKVVYDLRAPVKFEAWRADLGSFYAYSTASDEDLVVRPNALDASKSDVVRRRKGDRVGPVSGGILNVSSGNYPFLGIEFGSSLSSNKDRGTAYFFGPTVRLQSIGDHALLSLGSGISFVHVKEYPGIGEGSTYGKDDPLLQGRMRARTAWYFSIGLAASFGSSSGSK